MITYDMIRGFFYGVIFASAIIVLILCGGRNK